MLTVDDRERIREGVKKLVSERIELSRDSSDDEILQLIDQSMEDVCNGECLRLAERTSLRQEIFYAVRRLDILQELLDDEEITEIMINGEKNIFIEKQGKIYKWDKCFESVKKLEDVIQQIVSSANRIVNQASPIVDARLLDGSRVNVVLPPVAIDGPMVTIRKFPKHAITMEDLILKGSITREVADFLEGLVKAGYNIFISGGTGSGKTTFLNALSYFIPKDERIITIEDSAELQIKHIPNLVRLEMRNANVEGENEISIRDLIKSSLRMRPSRIIVGEIRDGAALDLLTAYNSGHDGSLSSGHANSPSDMLARLETLVLFATDIPLMAVRKQIASAIDIIVHLGRIRDKTRKVLEICEVLNCVDGEIELNRLFTFKEDGVKEDGKVNGKLVKTNGELIQISKLYKAGVCDEKGISL